jgi:hypothetical protein
MPDAVSDLVRVVELADRGVPTIDKYPHHFWCALTKGLTEYRAGKATNALDWLNHEAIKRANQSCKASVASVLVMVNHRLGRNTEAAEALAEARAIIADYCLPDPNGRQPMGGSWHDCLHSRILFREAKELLKSDDPETAADSEQLTTNADIDSGR